VLGSGARVSAAGIAPGALPAALVGRALAPQLTSVSVFDAGAYALATGLVLLIATTAIRVPR
jgi:sulfite exporter TauE/SafE